MNNFHFPAGAALGFKIFYLALILLSIFNLLTPLVIRIFLILNTCTLLSIVCYNDSHFNFKF